MGHFFYCVVGIAFGVLTGEVRAKLFMFSDSGVAWETAIRQLQIVKLACESEPASSPAANLRPSEPFAHVARVPVSADRCPSVRP